MTRGNQREIDRKRAQARKDGKKSPNKDFAKKKEK